MARKTESAHFGQTIITESGVDKSGFKKADGEALMGKRMGGGPRDISHSVSGGSTVDYNDQRSGRKASSE